RRGGGDLHHRPVGADPLSPLEDGGLALQDDPVAALGLPIPDPLGRQRHGVRGRRGEGARLVVGPGGRRRRRGDEDEPGPGAKPTSAVAPVVTPHGSPPWTLATGRSGLPWPGPGAAARLAPLGDRPRAPTGRVRDPPGDATSRRSISGDFPGQRDMQATGQAAGKLAFGPGTVKPRSGPSRPAPTAPNRRRAILPSQMNRRLR